MQKADMVKSDARQRDTWQSQAASNKLPAVCKQRPFPQESFPTRLIPHRDKEVKQQAEYVSHFWEQLLPMKVEHATELKGSIVRAALSTCAVTTALRHRPTPADME